MNRSKTGTFLACGAISLISLVITAVCIVLLTMHVTVGTASAEDSGSTGSGGLFATWGMKNAVPPENVAAEYLDSLATDADGNPCVITTDGARLYIDRQPTGAESSLLFRVLQGSWNTGYDAATVSGTNATVPVYITCVNTSALAEPLRAQMQSALEAKAAAAQSSSELYNEDGSYRSDVLDDLFWNALGAVSAEAKNSCCVTVQTVLNLVYEKRAWHVTNAATVLQTLDDRTAQLKADVTAALTYVALTYTIDENATAGPAPEQTNFGETSDPAVVSALLQQREAQSLINGQTLCWNEGIEFLPGSVIRYYLDESILMIQWQEKEQGMVGTFGEVFIRDGSQIRRKIAGDAYGDMNFRTTSAFAQETNAVLAVGGDFYNHGRSCGVVVYQRGLYRYDFTTCDTCYITASGDMLFSYQNQFTTNEEAEAFVRDNDVLFSLCFGPVMIDNGQDVTPEDYTWGEVKDTYARAALGLLGEKHYLTMNLNCGTGDTYGYATLRMAADAMVKRNCIKAYTLDGGQTATTAVNGTLVNPVQFGWEKEISDILYFATAVPN